MIVKYRIAWLAVLLVNIAACQSINGVLPSSTIDPSVDTYKLFIDYLNSPTAEKRRQIREATGTQEILASRVYKLFELYGTKGFLYAFDDNRIEFDAVRRELHENIHFTLWALKPIVHEPPLPDMEFEWEQQASLYISMCAGLASVEHDNFAHSILAELTRHTNPTIAEEAKEMLHFIMTEQNYLVKSRRYKKTQDWLSLNWLESNYFRPRKMTRSEIVAVIGEGIPVGDTTYAYLGKLENGETGYLLVSYYDNLLFTTKWVSKLPTMPMTN